MKSPYGSECWKEIGFRDVTSWCPCNAGSELHRQEGNHINQHQFLHFIGAVTSLPVFQGAHAVVWGFSAWFQTATEKFDLIFAGCCALCLLMCLMFICLCTESPKLQGCSGHHPAGLPSRGAGSEWCSLVILMMCLAWPLLGLPAPSRTSHGFLA